MATFHTPDIQAPKWSKLKRIVDLENFHSPLTLEVQRENTPYSSLELNESDTVNRQSGVTN